MTHNSQKYTAKLFLVSTAALLLTGCGGSCQKGQIRRLEERLKVAAKTAENAFINGLGTLIIRQESDIESPVPLEINYESVSLGNCILENTNSFEGANKRLKMGMYFYFDYKQTSRKGATGALAAFFYPLFDKLVYEKDDDKLKNPMWISLTRIILECKESLVQLVKKPSDYSASKLKKILDDCEQKLQAAPELILEDKRGYMILKEKPGGTAQDYYQEPGVKEAFEAFKKKVAALQANYEKVTGKGKQEDATKKAASKAS